MIHSTKFPEISVQNWKEWFGPTRNVLRKINSTFRGWPLFSVGRVWSEIGRSVWQILTSYNSLMSFPIQNWIDRFGSTEDVSIKVSVVLCLPLLRQFLRFRPEMFLGRTHQNNWFLYTTLSSAKAQGLSTWENLLRKVSASVKFLVTLSPFVSALTSFSGYT